MPEFRSAKGWSTQLLLSENCATRIVSGKTKECWYLLLNCMEDKSYCPCIEIHFSIIFIKIFY